MNVSSTNSPRLAKAAGWFYFSIILTSILSLGFLGGKFTVMGDNAATVAKMVEHRMLVRVNAAYEALMFAAVIVLAVLLFEMTRRIHVALARGAMLLRVGEAMLGMLGIVLTLGAMAVAQSGDATEGGGGLAVALLELKDIVYQLLMICISLGTIIFFALFYKARLLPAALTVWGMVGFSLMLVAGLLQILNLAGALVVNGIAAALAITFELVVGLWLIVKGVRAPAADAPSPQPRNSL